MNFWNFCEKVSGCVGEKLVVQHCGLIYKMFVENKTVSEVTESIKMAYPDKYFWKIKI